MCNVKIEQERNNWIFNNVDPSVEHCKQKFLKEMAMVVHRAKAKSVDQIKELIQVHS